MIDKVHILALKSIKDLSVECSKLNLFVGTNSSGKSTFLHALLALTQRSLSSKQSFINGENKPFMGLFLLS